MALKDQTFIFLGEDKQTTERQVFEAFCDIQPNFPGRSLKNWERGANPPDFLCQDFSGQRIGVELTEWVNEGQIAAEKARQDLIMGYLQIIQSERETPPKNIEFVTLAPNRKAPSRKGVEEFRRQLFECIGEVDSRWDSPVSPVGAQPRLQWEFPNHSRLSKHLGCIQYWPVFKSRTPLGIRWIRFRPRGGAYNPEAMVSTLIQIIRKKTAMYKSLHRAQQLSELYLVAYYGSAMLYNPPYHGLNFGFQEVASAISAELSSNAGCFDKVFLFSPVEKNEKILQVWPSAIVRASHSRS